MRPRIVFFLNSSAGKQFFKGKLARESHKAADPCSRTYMYNKGIREGKRLFLSYLT